MSMSFLVSLIICKQVIQELWTRWAWTLRDKNLISRLIKNFSEKFVHKWGQPVNELIGTDSEQALAYYTVLLITAVKSFIAHSPVACFTKLFRAVINLEYLSLSVISTLGWYLLERPMPTRVKKPLTGLQDLSLPANVRRGQNRQSVTQRQTL